MKAIFYLPAHPSYFSNAYNQEEIDKAISEYDEMGGNILSSNPMVSNVTKEFRLLREPGKTPLVVFENDELGEAYDSAIEQYRVASASDLQIDIQNLENILDGNRKFGG